MVSHGMALLMWVTGHAWLTLRIHVVWTTSQNADLHILLYINNVPRLNFTVLRGSSVVLLFTTAIVSVL